MTIAIRRANAADAASLAAFAERTFIETFGDANRPDDLREHIEASFGAAKQGAEIADSDTATWLAEDAQGALIGYVQVRRKRIPDCVAGERPIEVHRFYVDRTAHGTGLARELMATAFAQVREWGGDVVWLGVWEENARAIAFYRKCGFVDVGSIDFFVGPDRQTDRVLVLPLAER